MNSVRSLQDWFYHHISENSSPYSLDKDQAKIILDTHKNTLVTARAGSGKTRTIVAKIIYLIAHENYHPDELVVFAFNRKARAEINARLAEIYCDGRPLLKVPPEIATTFHAFAYQQLIKAGQSVPMSGPEDIDFLEMLRQATPLLAAKKSSFRFIMIDEYQDFSRPFLDLIYGLRTSCPKAHLLSVGDDWQAINRFAGSDVEYFLNFKKYFPEDYAHLYITSNYRSGKRIVETANYFMSSALHEYRGGKSKCKTRSHIYLADISQNFHPSHPDLPLLLSNYLDTVTKIIKKHPGKSIKLLSRNNDLSFKGWSLQRFAERAITETGVDLTYSTIHRSKGLESDIVILLEVDAKKFPNLSRLPASSGNLDDPDMVKLLRRQIFLDEARLFYVALTRARESLYILTKTPRVTKKNAQENFLNFLNDEWLEDF